MARYVAHRGGAARWPENSLTAFRSESYQWLQVAELSYDSFMMRMRTRT